MNSEYKSCSKHTRQMTCKCEYYEGYTRILNSHSHVGLITQFHENGVFKNRLKRLHLENNYCPQCGAAIDVPGRQATLQEFLNKNINEEVKETIKIKQTERSKA